MGRFFAIWRLFERVFENNTVHTGKMKILFTKINNDTGSEGDGASKDGYIS
jgi:hypothetical protein